MDSKKNRSGWKKTAMGALFQTTRCLKDTLSLEVRIPSGREHCNQSREI